MTDVMLAWQTERLLELESGRDSHTVQCARSSWSRSRSTASRRAVATPEASRSLRARQGVSTGQATRGADTIDAVRAIHDGVAP